jgi:GNAT superfamily N-acetyltransferase
LRRRMTGILHGRGQYAVVAVRDDKVVGLLHAFERPALDKPHEVVVQALVVDDAYRGTGIGGELMAAAEAWAGRLGIDGVSLYTNVDRKGAYAFYERRGYDHVATSHLMRRPVKRLAGPGADG